VIGSSTAGSGWVALLGVSIGVERHVAKASRHPLSIMAGRVTRVTILGGVRTDVSEPFAKDHRHIRIDVILGDTGAIVAAMVWRIADTEEGHGELLAMIRQSSPHPTMT
jgi:hypothetical protein